MFSLARQRLSPAVAEDPAGWTRGQRDRDRDGDTHLQTHTSTQEPAQTQIICPAAPEPKKLKKTKYCINGLGQSEAYLCKFSTDIVDTPIIYFHLKSILPYSYSLDILTDYYLVLR